MRTIRRWSAVALVAGALAPQPAAAVGDLFENDRILPEQPVDSTAGDYLAGRYARGAGDIVTAARLFVDALNDDPANVDLKRQAYRLLVAAGRVDEALPLAAEVAGNDGGDGLAPFVLALAAIRAADFDTAAERLGEVAADGFYALLRPVTMAWVRAGQGRAEDALAALGPLDQNDGFRAFKTYHEALLHAYLGDGEAADRIFRAALESDAARSLRGIEAYADFLARQGRADEARALFEQYVPDAADNALVADALERLDRGDAPAFVRSPADGVAEALYGAARALLQNGSRDVTAAYTQLAIYLNPDLTVARALLGNLYELQDRFADAIAAYGEIDPDSALGWNARLRIAASYDRLDKTDEAVALLREMADEMPERTDAVIGLADLLRRHERWDEAIVEYDRAVERMGTLSENDWTVLYSRGIALERSDRWDRAEADFLRALELRPDQPLVLNYLGYSWVEQRKNLDRAKQMIQKAVDLRPRDGYIVDSLGWVYYQLGEFTEAVRLLERAIVLRPDDPVINEHLGDAYWRVGRRQEARFQWRRALSFEPEADQVPIIERKLEKGLEGS